MKDDDFIKMAGFITPPSDMARYFGEIIGDGES